jgi:anti-anti-sigma factor
MAVEGATVVWLQGDHDVATEGELRRVLLRAIEANDAAIVLDLSEAGLISASTLGVIVAARKALRSRSRSLTIRSASAYAQRIIGICGLSSLLRPSPETAGGLTGTALASGVGLPAASPARLSAQLRPRPRGAPRCLTPAIDLGGTVATTPEKRTA